MDHNLSFVDTFKGALPKAGGGMEQQQQRNIGYISNFLPNNTKCYCEKCIVCSRWTHETKVPDPNGCFTLIKAKIKARHPKIKQNRYKSAHQCLRETAGLDDWTRFQVPCTGKKDCLSKTWKLENNSGNDTETNYGLNTLRITKFTRCQPFHLILKWTHLN